MEVKLYGREDDDPRLLEAVMRYAESVGATQLTVAMHQRRPLGGRPCGKPGSVTYDFILNGDGYKPLAARQNADGTILCPTNGA